MVAADVWRTGVGVVGRVLRYVQVLESELVLVVGQERQLGQERLYPTPLDLLVQDLPEPIFAFRTLSG